MLLKVNPNPSQKELRQFGWTLVIGFAILGGLLMWRGKPHMAQWVWAIGIPLGFLALFIQPAARPLYHVWMSWAVFMGGIMTRIILTVLFFGVVTPVALLFRILGRDALSLKKNPEGKSYWSDHRRIVDPNYYQRLF